MSDREAETVPDSVLRTRARLQRTFHPRRVAVVGMSDASRWAAPFSRTLDSEAELYFVHPTADTVFGRPAYRSLRDIGVPIDTVYSQVPAQRTVDVLKDAVAIGAGGFATVATGFLETGGEGADLQRQLLEVANADGMPVVGPNAIGFINAPENLDLTLITFERRPGGLSAIAHSGAMLAAMAVPAWRAGGVGLNLLISAGNEAVTDTADYLDFLVEDPATKIIAVMLEKIRRPELFFAAAARALRAGKPIVALKLARSDRARRMAMSHTGTLTGDAWVYDIAFKQAGIIVVRDVDELIDSVQVLEQLDPSKWCKVDGLGVLSGTGGFAQVASDLAELERVNVPEVPRLRPWLLERVPGAEVVNPLDTSAFVVRGPETWTEIVDTYAAAEELDVLMYANNHADWNETVSTENTQRFVDTVRKHGKVTVLTPLAGNGGRWLGDMRAGDVAVTNGLRPALKAVGVMSQFMRTPTTAAVRSARSVPTMARPEGPTHRVAEGLMLGFDATMQLLARAGIPVAPYVVTATEIAGELPFPGPYVVKLAELAHRTEHDAVRVRVGENALTGVQHELVSLARELGMPETIAVQPMLDADAEAFLGLNGATELGPVVAFGPGGILVEILKRIGGRIAPLTARDAGELLEEFRDLGIFAGIRGGRPWDVEALTSLLVSAGQLAAAGREWIASIDINPLMLTPQGWLAVDGLCLLKTD